MVFPNDQLYTNYHPYCLNLHFANQNSITIISNAKSNIYKIDYNRSIFCFAQRTCLNYLTTIGIVSIFSWGSSGSIFSVLCNDQWMIVCLFIYLVIVFSQPVPLRILDSDVRYGIFKRLVRDIVNLEASDLILMAF